MVIGTAAEALKDLSEKSDQFAARELAERIEREEREREERRLQAEVRIFYGFSVFQRLHLELPPFLSSSFLHFHVFSLSLF